MEGELVLVFMRNVKFEVPKQILLKAPYFATLFADTNVDEPIILNRSPKIFSHIIESLYDEKYPFPMKYAYELDFYLIEIDNVNIYDPYKHIVKSWDLDKYNKLHVTSFNKLQELIINLKNHSKDHKKETFTNLSTIIDNQGVLNKKLDKIFYFVD